MPNFSSWLKFHVVTLDQASLQRAVSALADKARSVQPNLLIGIRSGGFVVAQDMARAFPQATLLPITCRRPSTEKKQSSSAIKNMVSSLPLLINNRLRIAEHIVLTQLRRQKLRDFTPDGTELGAIARFIGEHNGLLNILIIDDAVDSGATLAAVTDAIKALAPAAAVKTAVITVTTVTPCIEPDFALYRYALCRFPWSLDFKQ